MITYTNSTKLMHNYFLHPHPSFPIHSIENMELINIDQWINNLHNLLNECILIYL